MGVAALTGLITMTHSAMIRSGEIILFLRILVGIPNICIQLVSLVRAGNRILLFLCQGFKIGQNFSAMSGYSDVFIDFLQNAFFINQKGLPGWDKQAFGAISH
jgi:hypothetical protein